MFHVKPFMSGLTDKLLKGKSREDQEEVAASPEEVDASANAEGQSGEQSEPSEIDPLTDETFQSSSAHASDAGTTDSTTATDRDFMEIDESTPLANQIANETKRREDLKNSTLPTPAETRFISVSNQKGGVGKTTTTVNLAAALAKQGLHVLVVDIDPQGNASTALGIDHRAEVDSIYDVLINDVTLAEVIQTCPDLDNLVVAPATIHLAGAEIELVSLVAREQRLRRSLEEYAAHRAAQGEPRLDYIFIDCPPSLGLLTVNAFVAAKEVLIPIQCEYYALEGLSQLLNNIKLIQKHLNSQLDVSTILLTMYDGRTNLASQVAAEVREHFPSEVLEAVIPRSVRISEAPSYQQTVITYDPNSTGALSYMEAASEIAKRGAEKTAATSAK